MNTYSHLLPGLQEDAVARFESVSPAVVAAVGVAAELSAEPAATSP